MPEELSKKKQELIEQLFEKGILLNQEMLDNFDESLFEKIESEADLLVLNSDYSVILNQQGTLIDWYETDKLRVDAEKERDDELYQSHLQETSKSSLLLKIPSKIQQPTTEISSLETALAEDTPATSFETEAMIIQPEKNIEALQQTTSLSSSLSTTSAVTVILSYENIPHKYTIRDFTNFFTSRYRFLESILRNHRELQSTASISRVLHKKERESAAVIGVVEEIGETRNGNIMITIEDPTGRIKVFVSKNNRELYPLAKDLVVDEVIGVSGTTGDKIIFADNIIWPDIPSHNEMKKGPKEEYAIFLSDIHVGSRYFLTDDFNRFLRWVRGEAGNEEQRDIARKTKYIIIAGDLVDGVGIYPSHEQELDITDIKEQYAEFARLMKQIPQDKQIIMCPGNHDMVHLAEPQPVFYQKFAPTLFDLPNATLVTNPSYVNIGKTKDFEGFNILLYHGFSFDYYVANVESIRMNGGYHRSDLIMKFLLKRRHLAPSFKSTPYYPSHKEDPLLIKQIPDFLITGHIHYSTVANYKGVTMICGSCWQGMTSFQEKLGHDPEPSRVPAVNLKTREVKVLRFG